MQPFILSAIYEFPIMALVSMGFFIALRMLKFPDLTIDAAVMGGMTAVGVAIPGFGIWWSLFLAAFLGAVTGLLTGLLHANKHVGVSQILAGMLVSFAAYSVFFRALGHRAELSLFRYRDVIFGESDPELVKVGIGLSLVVVVYVVTAAAFKTPFGYALRVSGHRPEMMRVLGIQPEMVGVLGLCLSNAVVGVGGWFSAVSNTNIGLQNFGMVIHALAAVKIGDFFQGVLSFFIPAIKNNRSSMFVVMIAPLGGALVYSFIKSFVLQILSGELKHAITQDFQLVVAFAILLSVTIGRRFYVNSAVDQNEVF